VTDETPQPSVASDDNWLVLWVPTIADTDAPTDAELLAGTKITYSLTPDGWNPSQSQATIADNRLTLGQALERPGRKTKSLTVKYVSGSEDDVAADVLVEGTEGNIVVRRGVPNGTAVAAGQKVTIWPVKCGEQIENPPVENGVDTSSQTLFVTGVVKPRVAVVAA
jgi:hypothetical protein